MKTLLDKKIIYLVFTFVTGASFSCQNIVIKMNKGKQKSDTYAQSSDASASIESTSTNMSLQDVTDYLEGIDDLSKAEKIEKIISLLNDDFKIKFRKSE